MLRLPEVLLAISLNLVVIGDIRDALLRKYPTLSDTFHDGSAIGPAIDGSIDDDEEESGVKLIGNSSVMIRVALEIGEIAKMTRPVLITGKSGTGKEVVANEDPRNEFQGGPEVRCCELWGDASGVDRKHAFWAYEGSVYRRNNGS